MIYTPNIQAALRDLANNDLWDLVGSGAPTNTTNTGTGYGFAGKGSSYNDIATGLVYINTGTKTSLNWLASIGTISLTLTNAQIKALRATPITLVGAPGSGKFVMPISCIVELIYGGNNAFTSQANDNLGLKWKDGTTTTILSGGVQAFLQATNSAFNKLVDPAVNSDINVSKTNVDNQPLVIHNISAAEIAGNAANDNTIRVNLHYSIQTSV